MHERLERLEEQMQSLDETIHGNGHPGLKTAVATLKTQMQDVPERLGRLEKYLWIGMGGLGVLQLLLHYKIL